MVPTHHCAVLTAAAAENAAAADATVDADTVADADALRGVLWSPLLLLVMRGVL